MEVLRRCLGVTETVETERPAGRHASVRKRTGGRVQAWIRGWCRKKEAARSCATVERGCMRLGQQRSDDRDEYASIVVAYQCGLHGQTLITCRYVSK